MRYMWQDSTIFGRKVIHSCHAAEKKFYIPIICLTVWDFHLSNPKQPLLWIHTKNIIYYIHKKRDKLVCSNKHCCTMNKTYRMIRKYDIQQYQAQVNTVLRITYRNGNYVTKWVQSNLTICKDKLIEPSISSTKKTKKIFSRGNNAAVADCAFSFAASAVVCEIIFHLYHLQ